MKDLVCLAADKNIEAALRGLLSRPDALGLRALEFEILVHPNRDPGCYHDAAGILRSQRDGYSHGLVVLDQAWEGAPTRDALALEQDIRNRLAGAGWADVVVIDPEIEVWVWSDSPHVDDLLGWRGRDPDLRAWLRQRGFWVAGDAKPADPKGAVEAALNQVRTPRSSSIYGALARKVSVQRCTDASFARFRSLLECWFPR